MDLEAAAARAAEIRSLYAQLEQSRHGRAWTTTELALGFVGDVGDLAKLVAASAGIRSVDGNVDEAIAHELADCLWSVLVLADALDVDLTRAFSDTMDALEIKVRAQVVQSVRPTD